MSDHKWDSSSTLRIPPLGEPYAGQPLEIATILQNREVYGIPAEQVVGTAGGTTYGYDKDGKPILSKDPKLLLNDNDAGKPEGIHLMIGRRPYASFGNS